MKYREGGTNTERRLRAGCHPRVWLVQVVHSFSFPVAEMEKIPLEEGCPHCNTKQPTGLSLA